MSLRLSLRLSLRGCRLISVGALLWVGACSDPSRPATGTGGTTGTPSGGTTGTPSGGTTGTPSGGTTGTPSGGTTGTPSGGVTGTGGSNAGGTTGALAGATGTGGSTGTGGNTGAGGGDPTAPRPINVIPGANFSASFMGQPMALNKSKPAQGKLVLFLGGIGGGPGSGGIDGFVHLYGFHIFMPRTQTSLTGGSVPAKYKVMLTDADPTNDVEANRQVGDARTDLWDGKHRTDWVTVAPGASMLEETIAAIKFGMTMDPGGDWGYFLNADGTLRTTDVWVVGYSWGSQTWAMISPYVPFGRVVTTSGPVNEGWPNGKWMTDPSLTPNDKKYLLVSDGQVADIAPNCMKAGWPGPITMVTPTSPGPYMSTQHLFEMVGGNGGISPGGHTVFCNGDPANGWAPVCRYVFGQQM